jgi:hypothetical protein
MPHLVGEEMDARVAPDAAEQDGDAGVLQQEERIAFPGDPPAQREPLVEIAVVC